MGNEIQTKKDVAIEFANWLFNRRNLEYMGLDYESLSYDMCSKNTLNKLFNKFIDENYEK